LVENIFVNRFLTFATRDKKQVILLLKFSELDVFILSTKKIIDSKFAYKQ